MRVSALGWKRPAYQLLLAAAVSCAAGGVLVAGIGTGYEWQAAILVAGVVAVAAAMIDERIALGLLPLSFLAISQPSLRLKVGGLWIPLPVLFIGILGAREVAQHASGMRRNFSAVPGVGILILATGVLASGLAATQSDLYVAGLVKWSANVFAFVTLAVGLRRRAACQVLVDGLSAVVGVLTLLALYRVFSGATESVDFFEGISTRNAAAMYIAAILPIAYGRLSSKAGLPYEMRIVLIGVLLVGLVFTFSRGGWIATACGLLLVTGRRLRAYLLIGIAAAILIATVPQEVRDRFASIFVATEAGELRSSTPVREVLLKTGLRTVRSHWLLGVGIGHYLGYYHRYAAPGAPPIAMLPHNYYVLLWAEGGVLSLLGFLHLYGSCVRRMWRSGQRIVDPETAATLRGFTGCFVALAIHALFSNDINNIMVWTLLGIGCALAATDPVEGQ